MKKKVSLENLLLFFACFKNFPRLFFPLLWNFASFWLGLGVVIGRVAVVLDKNRWFLWGACSRLVAFFFVFLIISELIFLIDIYTYFLAPPPPPPSISIFMSLNFQFNRWSDLNLIFVFGLPLCSIFLLEVLKYLSRFLKFWTMVLFVLLSWLFFFWMNGYLICSRLNMGWIDVSLKLFLSSP